MPIKASKLIVLMGLLIFATDMGLAIADSLPGNIGQGVRLIPQGSAPGPNDLAGKGNVNSPGHLYFNGAMIGVDPNSSSSKCIAIAWAEPIPDWFLDLNCNNAFDSGTETLGLGSGGGAGSGFPFTTAVSEATAAIISNPAGTDGWKFWIDPTLGPIFKCFIVTGDCPTVLGIESGETLTINDQAAGLPMLVINPAAASRTDMWKLQPGYEVLLSTEVPLKGSGGCVVAEEAIITDDNPDDWLTCQDAVGDFVSTSYKITPKLASATSHSIEMTGVYLLAGTPDANLDFQCSGNSIRPGADTFTAHNTTGEQLLSFSSFDTQRRYESASVSYTINGTIQVGSLIKLRCRVANVPTEVTDIRIHATAVITVLGDSFSD